MHAWLAGGCRTQVKQAHAHAYAHHWDSARLPAGLPISLPRNALRASRQRQNTGPLWTLNLGRLVDAWGRAWAATGRAGNWTLRARQFLVVRPARAAKSFCYYFGRAAGKFYTLGIKQMVNLFFFSCCVADLAEQDSDKFINSVPSGNHRRDTERRDLPQWKTDRHE